MKYQITNLDNSPAKIKTGKSTLVLNGKETIILETSDSNIQSAMKNSNNNLSVKPLKSAEPKEEKSDKVESKVAVPQETKKK